MGILPFFFMPATIAFFGKHEDVGWIAGLNVLLGVVPVLLSSTIAEPGVSAFVIVLIVWLALLRWAISGSSRVPG